MDELEIIDLAIESLKDTADIEAYYNKIGHKELDGQLELMLLDYKAVFNVEIKNELRAHQLPKIFDQANRYAPLIVVAQHIFPLLKKKLRDHNINYLETNGNVWIKQPGFIVWIEHPYTERIQKEKGNRAFTKTGLKVLYDFLLHEEHINLPYREIAEMNFVALGNINYIINGLKERNFLINVNDKEYKLHNKVTLLEKWVTAYGQRLKPTLLVDTYRFLREDDLNNWKNLSLTPGKTWWGGEPAAELLTNYLRPAEWVLYTTETKAELMKHYRLVPDEQGPIKVFRKFWGYTRLNEKTVSPLLVYADLINSTDSRCIETAQKIYHEFLHDKL